MSLEIDLVTSVDLFAVTGCNNEAELASKNKKGLDLEIFVIKGVQKT